MFQDKDRQSPTETHQAIHWRIYNVKNQPIKSYLGQKPPPPPAIYLTCRQQFFQLLFWWITESQFITHIFISFLVVKPCFFQIILSITLCLITQNIFYWKINVLRSSGIRNNLFVCVFFFSTIQTLFADPLIVLRINTLFHKDQGHYVFVVFSLVISLKCNECNSAESWDKCTNKEVTCPSGVNQCMKVYAKYGETKVYARSCST